MAPEEISSGVFINYEYQKKESMKLYGPVHALKIRRGWGK
jgi:hypothetical protein